MKTINCQRCGKEIEMRGARKYCIQCRKIVDHESAIKYRIKHYKGGTIRKPEDFENPPKFENGL